MPAHAELTPSAWVRKWSAQIRPGGSVLDVACGSGRHAAWLAKLGFEVDAVDLDPALFRFLPARLRLLGADLESGPWPYAGRRFDAIVVTNYLHRPLLPVLVDSLEPGGVLIYETFAIGNERFGKPSNPRFLLQPGELLDAVRGRLRVLAYEDLLVEEPRPAAVQRICARREQGIRGQTPI
jgi:SAM-dependent methyltransferase